jgi:hypothetical protein
LQEDRVCAPHGQANVVVDFGGATLDVTAAGEAACKLAEATGEVWEEYRDKALKTTGEEPPDDGVPRILEVTTSTSTVIGGEDEGYMITTGILLGVNVRLARPEETEAS